MEPASKGSSFLSTFVPVTILVVVFLTIIIVGLAVGIPKSNRDSLNDATIESPTGMSEPIYNVTPVHVMLSGQMSVTSTKSILLNTLMSFESASVSSDSVAVESSNRASVLPPSTKNDLMSSQEHSTTNDLASTQQSTAKNL
jgi:hypothetical protein